ncbi:MAG: dipeptide epimerase [Phycisphaerales bacterium]|nr:dipeptide epimerase [Phycisphaerales bacterium]
MKLSTERITARLRYPFRIARSGSSARADSTEIVRIAITLEHDGIVGMGEAVPVPYYGHTLESIEQTVASASDMLGDDLEDVDGIIDRLLDAFDDERAAVAGIDAAVHDWIGKRRGIPVWKMLGLDPTKTPPTSMTIGIDRLELLPEKVAQAADFKVLKIKVGTDAEIETLTEMRRLAPDKTLRVDANCGWPPEDIIERMQGVAPFELEFIEQPTKAGELDAVRSARKLAVTPLIADEDSVRPSDVPRLDGVYDGINVKLSKCGGIREALRMIADARSRKMQVMLGCMTETSLGVAPAAHIASLVDYADIDGHLLLAEDPFEGLTLKEGVVLPGDSPGLGIRQTSVPHV